MDMILDMFFLNFNNVNVLFAERELTWQLYLSAKTLLMTKQIQIISQTKSAIIVLNPGKEGFVIHVAYLRAKMSIHLT